jgi:hypothetical protein
MALALFPGAVEVTAEDFPGAINGGTPVKRNHIVQPSE